MMVSGDDYCTSSNTENHGTDDPYMMLMMEVSPDGAGYDDGGEDDDEGEW